MIEMKNESLSGIDRRSVLKALGATVTGGLIMGEAAANPSSDQIFKKGLEIREKTNSRKAFENHLLNHGFSIEQQNTQKYPFTEDNSEVSTNAQRIEKGDMFLVASVYTSGGECYADGTWRVTQDHSDAWNDMEDPGSKPVDIIGIGWEHSDYDINWNSWWSDAHSTQKKATTNNVAWRFDDLSAYADQFEGTSNGDLCFRGHADVKLKPTNPINERSIIVNYMHTWFGGSVSGVTFDPSGGMAVATGVKCKQWNGPKQAHSNDSL